MSEPAPHGPDDEWTAANCWVLQRLFSTCGAAGARAAQEGRVDDALVLTSLAGQFAWHAELLFDLLPTRAGSDAAALVAHGALGADDALGELDELARDGGSGAVCVVLARVVVPRLLAGVGSARARVDARLDGPRARALTLLVRDLRDALVALEVRAESALCAPGALEILSARCVVVERTLVAAGVERGLVAVGQDAWGG